MNNTAVIAQVVASYASRPDATIDLIVDLTRRLTLELNEPMDPQSVIGSISSPEADNNQVSSQLTPANAITEDKIFCLCCGRGFRMLRRHITSTHNLTEADYRRIHKLPQDYPLVAPGYSAHRAQYAKSVQFGKYDRKRNLN